jgi:hypothetical protein
MLEWFRLCLVMIQYLDGMLMVFLLMIHSGMTPMGYQLSVALTLKSLLDLIRMVFME